MICKFVILRKYYYNTNRKNGAFGLTPLRCAATNHWKKFGLWGMWVLGKWVFSLYFLRLGRLVSLRCAAQRPTTGRKG